MFCYLDMTWSSTFHRRHSFPSYKFKIKPICPDQPKNVTDFVCRDQGIVKVGGVHVIITFYPEDESEYTQIKGRTCRQDNPGYVSWKYPLCIQLTKSKLGIQLSGLDQVKHAKTNKISSVMPMFIVSQSANILWTVRCYIMTVTLRYTHAHTCSDLAG